MFNSINAQATYFYPIDLQENFVASKSFTSGIGNLGFDNYDGYFNPRFDTDSSMTQMLISANINMQYSEKYYYGDDGEGGLTKEGEYKLLPDISFKWQASDLLLQIHTKNTFQLEYNYLDQPYPFRFMSNNRFLYSYEIWKPHISCFNYNIQFDGSYSLIDELSISLGVSTNYFYKKIAFINPYNLKEYSIEYSVDPFNKFQYLVALNYSEPDLFKLYFVYRTMSKNNITNEGIFPLSNNDYVTINGYVNFPENISTGIQYLFSDNLKFSIEYYGDNYPNENEPDTKFIIPGINFRYNSIEAGLMFAYQVSKSGPDKYYTSYGVYEVKEEPSYMGALSLRYSLSVFDFYIHYQYMYKNYFQYFPTAKRQFISESQIIRTGVGVKF